MLFFDEASFKLVRNQSLLWEVPTSIRAGRIYPSPGGGIFVASHIGDQPELFFYKSTAEMRVGKADELLSGYPVTGFICDKQGGWWASTYGQGVFYCKTRQ
ncbi:MAG: hypothetical protein IPH04_01275 [Saprospirales bacterium]|nr:hypothetical protein [Saprospirales bacterium]